MTMQTEWRSTAIAAASRTVSLERGRAGSSLGRGLAHADSDRARLRYMSTQQPDSWSDTPRSAPSIGAMEHEQTRLEVVPDAVASTERRERLLAASATASRLLLQAPDVMTAVPKVLQLIGEAADADRVLLLLRQPDSQGSDPLVIAG